MKKGLIFTIICNTVIVLSIIIGFVSLFWVHFPKEIEKEELTQYMENKGCNMIEINNSDTTYLLSKNCPMNVSYLVTENNDKLYQVLLNQRNNVIKNTNITGNISIDIFPLYSEFSTSGDKYQVVTQNQNTILSASADKKYKKEIITLFKHFGYRYQLNWNALWWFLIPIITTIIIYIVSIWGIEKKIRNKGWIALIPIYNIVCLTKDIFGSPWYAIFLLMPIGNFVFMLFFHYYLGKAFQKDDSDCLLLMFFPTIFCPLLAFDNSEYKTKGI